MPRQGTMRDRDLPRMALSTVTTFAYSSGTSVGAAAMCCLARARSGARVAAGSRYPTRSEPARDRRRRRRALPLRTRSGPDGETALGATGRPRLRHREAESRLWRSYRGACHSFATTRDRSARARSTQTPYRSFTRRPRRDAGGSARLPRAGHEKTRACRLTSEATISGEGYFMPFR